MHSTTQTSARQHVIERAKALAPKFAARADAAEAARTIPKESAQDMLDAGIARILMPRRFGGYDLDFETWLDVIVELGKADASHAWCASLIIHHAHLLAQYPEDMQQAIWVENPGRCDRGLVRTARQGDARRRRLPAVGRPVELSPAASITARG